MHLRVNLNGNVEVVIPVGFNRSYIPDFVEKNHPWIAKTMLRLEKKFSLIASDEPICKPDEIFITAFHEHWRIDYIEQRRVNIKVQQKESQQLWLLGDVNDDEQCIVAIKRWLISYAKEKLTKHVQTISEQTQLNFNKISIRNQKTRWGSCSNKKNINLNFKLMLLPFDLMNYVIIHELCHTIHLNHSAKFWKLVALFEPDYKILDKQLKQSARYIPDWV
jgi:predicted metal-dependent hydrolase